MKRLFGYGLFALLVLCVALALQAPAALLTTTFAPDLKPLQLTGVSGTLRAGQARDLGVAGIPVGQVAWQWAPLALAGGRAEYALTVEGAKEVSGAGRLATRFDGALVASDWGANVPLGALRTAELPLPAELQGLIHLELERLVFRNDRLDSVSGRLQLRELRWVDAHPLQLGNFEMELAADENGALVGTLHDQGGVVGVTGTVRLEPAGSYRVQLQLKEINRAPDAVRGLLRTLAPVRPDGTAAVQWTGRWR